MAPDFPNLLFLFSIKNAMSFPDVCVLYEFISFLKRNSFSLEDRVLFSKEFLW